MRLSFVSLCCAAIALTAPSLRAQAPNLVASAGRGVIGLNWSDVVGATAYRVFRGPTAGGPFTQIAERDRSRHLFVAMPGVAHFFYVTSVSNGVESAPSSVVSATATSASLDAPALLGNYRIGSSYVCDHDRLQRFLQARGINVATYRRQIIGAGLEYIWNNTVQTNPAEHEGYVQILQNGSYSALIMNAQSPFLQGNRELEGTLLWAEEALAAAPNYRVFIHQYWITESGISPWDESLSNRARHDQWYWLTSLALAYEASRTLGVPVYVCPFNKALERAKEAALAGQLQITNSRDGFHPDGAHLNELGKFVQEGVAAAGAYQIDVRGTHGWVSPSITLPAGDAAVLQSIIHDTVRGTPFSGWFTNAPTSLSEHLDEVRDALSVHEGFDDLQSNGAGTFLNARSGMRWSYSQAVKESSALDTKIRLNTGGSLGAVFTNGLLHLSVRLRPVTGGAAQLRVSIDGSPVTTFVNNSSTLYGREVRRLNRGGPIQVTLQNLGGNQIELDDVMWDLPVYTPEGLTILTTELGPWPVGQPVSVPLAAAGGSNAFSWSLAAGALPAGLQLSAGGVVSGTPTANGTAQFTVQAEDGPSGHTVSQSYTVQVVAPTVITQHPQSTNIVLGDPLTLGVAATGDALIYQWFKDNARLPNTQNPVYSVNNAGLLDAGDYYAVVTGLGGSVTSAVATVSIDTQGAEVLSTVFNGGNLNLSGNTFNLVNTGTNAITLTGRFSGNFDAAANLRVSIYTRPGTAAGFANSSAGWTLWGTSDPFTGNGYGTGTPFSIAGTHVIPAGQTNGFYLLLTTTQSKLAYSSVSGGTTYVQGNLRMVPILGLGGGAPFAAQLFGPTRAFNGSVEFRNGLVSAPTTGGASTGGASTGGASTGGASTGGASTGGASTGGGSSGTSTGAGGSAGSTTGATTGGGSGGSTSGGSDTTGGGSTGTDSAGGSSAGVSSSGGTSGSTGPGSTGGETAGGESTGQGTTGMGGASTGGTGGTGGLTGDSSGTTGSDPGSTGSETGGAVTGGSGSGGGTGSAGGATGGQDAPLLTPLAWTVQLRAPKPNKTIRLKAGAVRLVKGTVLTAGPHMLPRGFSAPGLVEVAAVDPSQTNAAWAPATKIGKASRRGTVKFVAKSVAALNAGPGTSLEIVVRASTNFGFATSPTASVTVLVK